MKLKRIRLICKLLTALLLLPLLLPACAPGGHGGTGDMTEDTRHDLMTSPVESGREPGTTDPAIDTEPSTEPDTAPELFAEPEPIAYICPDFREYETLTVEPGPRTEIHRVEGEDYTSKTLEAHAAVGKEFSGGKMFFCDYNPASMENLYVEYKVTVEQAGSYALTSLSTPTGQSWTCDYWVTVNGGTKKTDVGSYRVLDSFKCPTLNNNDVLKVMDLTRVDLKAGENTIRFTIDPNDARSSNHATKVVMFLDWFELRLDGKSDGGNVSVSYHTHPEGEDAELLNGAARVQVFDCRYPIDLVLETVSDGEQPLPWSVTDYYGKTLWSGTLPAENGRITFNKAVNRHPTGYFTVRLGDKSLSYVVTPPLHTQAFEESPFAADFASYYLIGDAARVFDVSCAARLMGVTWVRERCDWSAYEPTRGTYSFASTDAVYDAIHRAGLKNLAMLCSSPSWARTSYVGTNKVDGMIGGFRDHQLDAYRMIKAMAAHYDGIVDGWELWNECDINSFAIEPADLYASWYKAAALAVMDAGVKNTVISMGGLCMGPDTPYMSQLLQSNVLAYSHTFNYHQHATYSPGYTPFVYRLMEYMNASVPAYTQVQKPMWVTEAGMRMDLKNAGGAPTEEQLKGQCYFIVTSAVESLSYGTDKHFWFVLSPYIENGGDFGTFSKSLTPYPTVAAEAVMTWTLGKGQYVGALTDVPNGCQGSMFDTGRGLTAVVWATQNNVSGYKYKFASEYPVTVTDMMGTRTLVEPVDGEITLRLDRHPIYITYRTAPAFSSQSFPERGIDFSLTVPESGRVLLTPLFPQLYLAEDKNAGYHIDEYLDLPVRILNLNDHEVTGRVIGECEGLTISGTDTLTIPAMSEVTVTITLQTVSDANVDAFLRLIGAFGKDGGRSVTVSHVYTQSSARHGAIEITKPRSDGKKLGKGQHDTLTAAYSSVQGTVCVWLNGLPYDNFTVETTADGGNVIINAADLTPGTYFMSVGVKPGSGEYVFAFRTFVIK